MGDEESVLVEVEEEEEEAMEQDTPRSETLAQKTTPQETSIIDTLELITEEESKAELAVKKRRKSRRKTDGYKARKRAKSVQQDPDEYEVEMIIDHRVEEDVL